MKNLAPLLFPLCIPMLASVALLATRVSAPAQTPAPEPPPPDTPADARGYTYKTVNGAAQKLDVFKPPGADAAKPRPVLVYFHGGGYVSGDKGYTTQLCRYFAKRGLVVVTANYRFMNKDAPGVEGTKVVCLLDAKSAIRWVRSHAKELGIDPDRVILGGSSAGAYLIMMAQLSTDFNDPADDAKIPTTASALLILSPPYPQPLLFADGKPPEHMDEPNAWLKPPLPPMIALFGADDPLHVNSTAFLLECKTLGAKVEIWAAPGQKHAFDPPQLWMDAMCAKADHFLGGLGLLEGPAPAAPAGAEFVRVDK